MEWEGTVSVLDKKSLDKGRNGRLYLIRRVIAKKDRPRSRLVASTKS